MSSNEKNFVRVRSHSHYRGTCRLSTQLQFLSTFSHLQPAVTLPPQEPIAGRAAPFTPHPARDV